MVTGKMEQTGLAQALGRLFPAHEFACVPRKPPNDHYDSFTSNPLPIPPPLTEGVRSNIDILVTDAAAMATEKGHPKRYLAWLCRDLQAKKCSSYKESEAATALSELGWSALMNRANMPFLYSLIDDLAQGLNADSGLPNGAVLEPRTCLKPPGNAAVLRNI